MNATQHIQQITAIVRTLRTPLLTSHPADATPAQSALLCELINFAIDMEESLLDFAEAERATE